MIAARFISKAPHYNRGIAVDLVSLVESSDAVHVVSFPLGIVADRIVGSAHLVRECSVRLQIVLIHDIESHFIGQLQKERIRRIVGSADHIDIEFFADPDVALDLVRRHSVAVGAAGVVMVYAVELDHSSIYKETVADDLHCLKSDLLLHTAALGLKVDVIESGFLRVPLDHVEVLENSPGKAFRNFDCFCAGYSVSLQGESDLSGSQCLRTKSERILTADFGGLRVDLTDIGRLADPQQNVTENPVVAEHILVLKISAVAPSVHDDHHLVGAFCEFACQIEFRCVVCAFRIADKFTVQIQIHAAGHSHEGDDIVLGGVLDLKISAVDADEIVLLSRVLVSGSKLLVNTDP